MMVAPVAFCDRSAAERDYDTARPNILGAS
jgi:hypothetical protein